MSASVPQDVVRTEDLSALVGEDEERARTAFERLWRHVRPGVLRKCARSVPAGVDPEDVVQDVASRLWRFRRRARAQTPAQWYALAWVTARRELADRAGERPSNLSLEEEAHTLFAQMPAADAWVAAAVDRDRIVLAADRIWLGESDDEEATAIGAAALVALLVDGLSAAEVETTFALSPEDLDRHLDDDATLARALFAALCWPNERLAGHVLRPTDPLSNDELESLVQRRSEAPPEGWSIEEARAACLRLRNGLTEEELVKASAGLTAESIASLLERIRREMPYVESVKRSKNALSKRGRENALAKEGLWRRIAFDYALRDLPHRQIEERAGPPAKEGGFVLGAERLNNWLSRGRIVKQIALALAEAAS